jgi:NADPH:quinone reductase-like Zn-dependent oxidoreductase
MHAAVVRSFDQPPTYDVFDEPAVAGPGEVLVEVVAAGLHPRVRSAADGSHYTSERALPMVPGIDGVGRTADGELLYFVAADNAVGSMAERAVMLPSYLLRAAALTIIGSGQGSVSAGDILTELPELAALITSGTLAINPLPVPLSNVQQAWTTQAAPGERVVLVP